MTSRTLVIGKVIGARAGKCSLFSTFTICPAWEFVILVIKSTARANASAGNSKSTPRSKRCEASVCRPKRRARAAIAS